MAVDSPHLPKLTLHCSVDMYSNIVLLIVITLEEGVLYTELLASALARMFDGSDCFR